MKAPVGRQVPLQDKGDLIENTMAKLRWLTTNTCDPHDPSYYEQSTHVLGDPHLQLFTANPTSGSEQMSPVPDISVHSRGTKQVYSAITSALLRSNPYRDLYLYLQGRLPAARIPEALTEKSSRPTPLGQLEDKKPNQRASFNEMGGYDSTFLELQRILGLHMGLFAYVDPADERVLRYLYGPQDLPQDEYRPKPHFFLQAHYGREQVGKTILEPESKRSFLKQSVAFYYTRAAGLQDWRTFDFVQLLRAYDGHDDNRADAKMAHRTRFEARHGIIYAASGEMDACILHWLFLHLEQAQRQIVSSALGQCKASSDGQYVRFTFSHLKESSPFSSSSSEGKETPQAYYAFWREGESRNLWSWLWCLGLLNHRHGDPGPNPSNLADFRVSQRGQCLLFWLTTYLTSLKTNSADFLGASELGFHRLVKPHPINPDDYWLKETDYDLLTQFVTAVSSDPSSFHAFLLALRILLPHPAQEDSEVDIKDRCNCFARRCRFSLYGHLVLRATDRGTHMADDTARGWLVFPVWAERSLLIPGDHTEVEDVGFFLGTISDFEYHSSFAGLRRRAFERRIRIIRARRF